MEINVAQLLKLPTGTTRTYEVDEDIDDVTETESSTRVHGDVKLLRTRGGILVQANLQTIVGCTCSRCLEAARCELKLQMEEEYFPTVDVNTGYPVEVPSDVTDFTIDANHLLSLDEAVRQYVLLNQPMQPLCKPDCAGLCSECGVDLNYETCDCHLKAEGCLLAGLEGLLGNDDDMLASNERS